MQISFTLTFVIEKGLENNESFSLIAKRLEKDEPPSMRFVLCMCDLRLNAILHKTNPTSLSSSCVKSPLELMPLISPPIRYPVVAVL